MAKAQKNFAEMLDDLINSYFDDAEKFMQQCCHRSIERRLALGESAVQIKDNQFFQWRCTIEFKTGGRRVMPGGDPFRPCRRHVRSDSRCPASFPLPRT